MATTPVRMVDNLDVVGATISHYRMGPKSNRFSYKAFYIMTRLPGVAVSGRWIRFDPKDLGGGDGCDPQIWADSIFAEYGFTMISTIWVLTMPRIFGYCFNPVCFYFGMDSAGDIRAVICYVRNTFRERHQYLCGHPDRRPIEPDDWITAQKVFHVSPFFERSGFYRFQFRITESTVCIHINYLNTRKVPQLMTTLRGVRFPYLPKTLRRIAWRSPLLTIMVIVMIHWQAVRLWIKGISVVRKPPQFSHHHSGSVDVGRVEDFPSL